MRGRNGFNKPVYGPVQKLSWVNVAYNLVNEMNGRVCYDLHFCAGEGDWWPGTSTSNGEWQGPETGQVGLSLCCKFSVETFLDGTCLNTWGSSKQHALCFWGVDMHFMNVMKIFWGPDSSLEAIR